MSKNSLLAEGRITTAQLKLGIFNIGLLRSSTYILMIYALVLIPQNLKELLAEPLGNLKIAN